MLDALKLMRIPFSIFLMPIFWLALVGLEQFDNSNATLIFIILHLFIYPASNGYNSYFDKDEGSIGGLKNPPKVNRFLFPTVVFFDFFSVLLSFLISAPFAVLITVYILVSKAYSYDKIRLKKYPFLSTFTVVFFQGFFIYLTIHYGLSNNVNSIFESTNILLAVCASLFLLGSYPLTQIYQHKEDFKRGDRTLSLLLGIRGTFIFSAISFLVATFLIFYVFLQQDSVNHFYIFLLCGSPIIMYFSFWFIKVLENIEEANFKRTMRMNMLSSICLSLAFIYILLN